MLVPAMIVAGAAEHGRHPCSSALLDGSSMPPAKAKLALKVRDQELRAQLRLEPVHEAPQNRAPI
jgi:hypothetical protein